jgi:beta-N-acetylhexosaminidase
MRAAILGIPGPTLDHATADLLRATPPAGVILFARNIETPGQLRDLNASLHAALPPGAVILVDQEGGRVARLRPPHFPAHPPAAKIGAVYRRDQARGLRAAFLTGAAIGETCREMGFDVVCAPVLDLALPGFDAVIGDRGFSADPLDVARLGRALADGLAAAGIQPVMKHLPGHGRATVDSHLGLPERDDLAEDELEPFIANADLPWAMTAHLLYRAQDGANPATLSKRIVQHVIRQRIGFAGVLVSDDLAMHALSGPPEDRARAALAAGCDLALYCPGDQAANRAVLEACPELPAATRDRLAAASAWAYARRLDLDLDALIREREELLA